jgi:hypothetical protein
MRSGDDDFVRTPAWSFGEHGQRLIPLPLCAICRAESQELRRRETR